MRNQMTKRERVYAAFHNQEDDRVPVCFWWHFPADLHPGEMVRRHLQFYKDTDEDMLKISCDGFFGWPAKALQGPLTTEKLYEMDHISLDHPYMRKQIDRVKAIVSSVDDHPVTIYTTFNPLSLFRIQVTYDEMMRLIREDPKAVMHACEVIREDHSALMEQLVEEGGVDGFLYSVQNAEVTRFTLEEYRSWVTPMEKKELQHAQSFSEYVVLHCCGWDADEAGTYNHLESWQDYPANMISWAAYVDNKTIPEIREFFHGLPCWGGFDNRRGSVIQNGTEGEVKNEARRLIAIGGKQGYMLGPDCSLPTMDPKRIRWIVEASKEA